MKPVLECGVCYAPLKRDGDFHCGKEWVWNGLSQTTDSRDDCRREAGDWECYEGHCPHRGSTGKCCICGDTRKAKVRRPRKVWTDDKGVRHTEW